MLARKRRARALCALLHNPIAVFCCWVCDRRPVTARREYQGRVRYLCPWCTRDVDREKGTRA